MRGGHVLVRHLSASLSLTALSSSSSSWVKLPASQPGSPSIPAAICATGMKRCGRWDPPSLCGTRSCHRNAVAGDGETLSLFHAAHYRAAVVPQFSLADRCRHIRAQVLRNVAPEEARACATELSPAIVPLHGRASVRISCTPQPLGALRVNSVSGNGYRPAITPFGGWVTDHRTGRLVPLETAPHILGLAPPGTGKTRRWLSQSAVLWPGPAVVSSSKDDLMQMVASRRWGKAMLLDLRPITPPHYPSAFTRCRYDPTALISTLEDAQGVAETMLAMSSVAFGGAASAPSHRQRHVGKPGIRAIDLSAVRRLPGRRWAGHALGAGGRRGRLSTPNQWPGRGEPLGNEPSWVTAATWCADRLFEARVRGILDMVEQQTCIR